ncbi:MAG: hypothetical protein ACI819_000233, partial [Neolewinella sp.]
AETGCLSGGRPYGVGYPSGGAGDHSIKYSLVSLGTRLRGGKIIVQLSQPGTNFTLP